MGRINARGLGRHSLQSYERADKLLHLFFFRLSTGGQPYPKNVLPQLLRCIERKGGEMVLGGFNGVRKVGPNEYGFALQGL